MTVQVRAWLERTALNRAMALPESAQRALAGRPVTVDGNTLAPDVQLMLRMQRIARLPGAEELPLDRGRRVLLRTTSYTAGDQPIGSVHSMKVADGLASRLYTPSEALSDPAVPGGLLVFFHGGGFWCGDLDTHDAGCRFLAEASGVRVLSVAYRLAPEHAFPAAYDDALAAYQWVVEHADELGADRARLGVGGDSAGGNLAAGVAIAAARDGWPCAVQLLLYPATQSRRRTGSAESFASGYYLTRDFMDAADRHYATDVPADDPRLSPLHADVPAGLAPALLYTAGFDPLRDEGEAYAEKLRAAGATVEPTRFDDQIHGFFNVVGVGRSSRAANQRVADDLRRTLGAP